MRLAAPKHSLSIKMITEKLCFVKEVITTFIGSSIEFSLKSLCNQTVISWRTTSVVNWYRSVVLKNLLYTLLVLHIH